jgi:LSD1 subclass zinc finger protein
VNEDSSNEDGVKTVAVSCNKCGAALDLPRGARFVTCTYCGSRLEVHRSGGAAYTEILESIDQRTEQIADNVEAIRWQNELERLDREWMIRRDSLMVTDKHGGRHVPGGGGALIGSIIAGVFGVIWTVAATSGGAPGFFTLFGIVFVVAAIGGGVYSVAKAGQYQEAEAAYNRQRGELLRKMQSGGRSDDGGA